MLIEHIHSYVLKTFIANRVFCIRISNCSLKDSLKFRNFRVITKCHSDFETYFLANLVSGLLCIVKRKKTQTIRAPASVCPVPQHFRFCSAKIRRRMIMENPFVRSLVFGMRNANSSDRRSASVRWVRFRAQLRFEQEARKSR